MEQPLIRQAVRRRRARIAGARTLQEIGWAGLAGLALCAAAALVAARAWNLPVAAERGAALVVERAEAHAPLAEPARPAAAVRLARSDEIPLLLGRIERAATGNGLRWSAADYRIVAATDRLPGALEIRCAFRAPYPAMRAMLAELIATLPAMTFRELSFVRADVGTAEVEAKLVIALFVDDDAAATASGR